MDANPHPIDVLHREHVIIRITLDALVAEARRLLATKDLREDWWLALLQFLEHYADRRHDEKEEHVLFPALVRAGMGERHGPLPVLRDEHESARLLRARMLDAFASRDLDALGRAALDYAEHVNLHAEQEERMLYPLAFELLDDAALDGLRRDFAAHDRATGTADGERYAKVADALARGQASDG